LIQYEVRVAQGTNLELVRAFAELGFDTYRLVPGLGCLVPFNSASPIDDFMLNLFCCKPARAARLEQDGFLIRKPLNTAALKSKSRTGFFIRLTGGDRYGWRRRLACLPYGEVLASLWDKTVATGQSSKVEDALSLYLQSQDTKNPIAERFAALEASLAILHGLCESEPHYLRRSSLARVAADYGARNLAVTNLRQLSTEILEQKRLDPSEPFLAASQHYDTLALRQVAGMQSMADAVGLWVCAAVLEALERSVAFSSYFPGKQSLTNLRNIRDLGYGSEEMRRRLELVEQRFGLL
jgi:hypothetical protein